MECQFNPYDQVTVQFEAICHQDDDLNVQVNVLTGSVICLGEKIAVPPLTLCLHTLGIFNWQQNIQVLIRKLLWGRAKTSLACSSSAQLTHEWMDWFIHPG